MFLQNHPAKGSSWKLEHYRDTYLVPRMLNLDVDYDISFGSNATQLAPIRDMILEEIENRFLLASYQDGSLKIFDVDRPHHDETLNQQVYRELVHITQHPKTLASDRRIDNRLSPSVCVQWYPVDSGLFFTASINKTVWLWDVNRLECADIFTLPGSISWIHSSNCATTHNLLAVALGRGSDGRTVLIDPVIGCGAITLFGGHSEAGVGSVAWSPHSTNTVVTGGFDGKILYWDIRQPTRPVYSLDKYSNPDNACYSPDVTAHAGPILALSFSPDGLHLYSWGCSDAAGNALSSRVWANPPGENPQNTPFLRPINFGSMGNESRTSGSGGVVAPNLGRQSAGGSNSASIANRGTGSVRIDCTPMRVVVVSAVAGAAWGAESCVMYAPCRSRLLMALASKRDVLTHLVRRHHARIRACVWNNQRNELYTGGVDGNLFVWPLFRDDAGATEEFPNQENPQSMVS